MRWIVEEVPWGNLIRTAFSTAFFAVCLSFPIAAFTPLDTGSSRPLFYWVVFLLAGILASIVVWSERVTWIGDP
ncbi:MAG: FtsH-binding integral membrane protein [Halobacteriales archaeon]